MRKQLLRFVGYVLISILTGLVVYQTPPESWRQFGEWMWLPTLTGLLDAMQSLGWNHVTTDRPR